MRLQDLIHVEKLVWALTSSLTRFTLAGLTGLASLPKELRTYVSTASASLSLSKLRKGVIGGVVVVGELYVNPFTVSSPHNPLSVAVFVAAGPFAVGQRWIQFRQAFAVKLMARGAVAFGHEDFLAKLVQLYVGFR